LRNIGSTLDAVASRCVLGKDTFIAFSANQRQLKSFQNGKNKNRLAGKKPRWKAGPD